MFVLFATPKLPLLRWVRLRLSRENAAYEWQIARITAGNLPIYERRVARALYHPRDHHRCYSYLSVRNGCGRPPYVLHTTAHGCTVHAVARRPSHPDRAHRAPLILHIRRRQMSLEVCGNLRQRERQRYSLPAF